MELFKEFNETLSKVKIEASPAPIITNELDNFTLECSDGLLPVDISIFCRQSSFFLAAFTNNMKEKSTAKIKLSQFSLKLVKTVYQFLLLPHENQLSFSWFKEQESLIPELIAFAHLYSIERLLFAMRRYLAGFQGEIPPKQIYFELDTNYQLGCRSYLLKAALENLLKDRTLEVYSDETIYKDLFRIIFCQNFLEYKYDRLWQVRLNLIQAFEKAQFDTIKLDLELAFYHSTYQVSLFFEIVRLIGDSQIRELWLTRLIDQIPLEKYNEALKKRRVQRLEDIKNKLSKKNPE